MNTFVSFYVSPKPYGYGNNFKLFWGASHFTIENNVLFDIWLCAGEKKETTGLRILETDCWSSAPALLLIRSTHKAFNYLLGPERTNKSCCSVKKNKEKQQQTTDPKALTGTKIHWNVHWDILRLESGNGEAVTQYQRKPEIVHNPMFPWVFTQGV